MEIQTRRHILEIWRATVAHSYQDGKWNWGSHRSGRNSISDAEQLLTILYPATAIDSLQIDQVDKTANDVLEYLRSLGSATDIPRRLIEVLTDYMTTYQIDGTPDFSGSSYFDAFDENAGPPESEQLKLHVVDSYSMSVTLCLATLGFLQVYLEGVKSRKIPSEVDELRELTSTRLTAAMVGLLRSFTISTFLPTDTPGATLCRMVDQSNMGPDNLARDLLEELRGIRAGLQKELSLGLGQAADYLDDEERLFECGWSWGIVEGAGLLSEEQQRLAVSLQLRWDLTQQFWAKIATFGSGSRWPMEDVPWTTTDRAESDYNSLLLTSIVVEGASTEQAIDVQRVGRLLDELASRGRITRRPTVDGPAIGLHIPGMELRLYGSEKVGHGPMLPWTVSSYSALILKRMLRVAQLIEDQVARLSFLHRADQIWAHLEQRRIEGSNGRGLWDEPTQVFTSTPHLPYDGPSWYHTERVIEALVVAANATESKTTADPEMVRSARRLIAEAEARFDQELLRGTNEAGLQVREMFVVVEANLRRARDLLGSWPGTASVLASDVLRELNSLDVARQDVARMN